MKKSLLTGAITAGLLGTLVFSTTVGDKEEIIYPKEELYSLTPDEVDAYDEYTEEELEQQFKVQSARVSYPLSAAISKNDSVKVKSADIDILGDILSHTDGKNNSYTPSTTNNYVQPQTNYVQPETEYHYVEEVKEETYTTPVVNEEYNQADKDVLSYFSRAKEEMQRYLASDDYANLKAKAKSIVVTGIDFLFYDGTIMGHTRNELTEKGKETVIKSGEEALLFLDDYFPGFSDSFEYKYSRAKEFLSEKFVNVLDKVKEWIGEEEYNTLGEDFKEIGSTIADVFDEHYQGWKKK